MMKYEIACVRCRRILPASEITQVFISGQAYHICEDCMPGWKKRWDASLMELAQDKLFWTPEREQILRGLDKDLDGFEVTEPSLLEAARRMNL